MLRAGVVRFAGTSLAVTSPLSDGIALPARVVPTGAPTAGLGRGALSGGRTRGVPGRQEWRGRRQADLRAGGAGGIPPSHPAREDAPYAAATPPLSWVSRRCPASRKRPGASAALFGGEADLANAKARAGCPAHPAARCQSAARCDGRSARAFADARTVPPKNDADWMARCHTVPPRLSIPDFATLSLFNEIKSHPYLSGSLNMSFLLYFSHEDFGKSSLWTPHTARHRLA